MNLQADDLRKYSFFSSLSDSALNALANSISEADFPAGSEIVREGEAGDAFYFVKRGRLEVTRKTKYGQEAKLSVIVEGQGFGEMALLTCSIRSSSVRALTDVTLYKIEKAVFEEIVLNEASFKYALHRKIKDHHQFDRIKTLQPFALLEPEKMHIVMEKMTEKRYARDEDIIVQGEKGDNYYIIKSGVVAVLKKKKDLNEYTRIAVLSDGEAFGEEALIRDDPRNATCRAMEDTTVFVLNKNDFSRIIKGSFLENIFPEDIEINSCLQDYVIIDARIPAEYEEEHIYGAVNIPVEALRQECSYLDKSKKYIAYCLNDSRGMVAAFLLKNRGFDAKCLRGGMSGWLGQVVTGSDGIHMPEKI